VFEGFLAQSQRANDFARSGGVTGITSAQQAKVASVAAASGMDAMLCQCLLESVVRHSFCGSRNITSVAPHLLCIHWPKRSDGALVLCILCGCSDTISGACIPSTFGAVWGISFTLPICLCLISLHPIRVLLRLGRALHQKHKYCACNRELS
jgi:hypothetical protein